MVSKLKSSIKLTTTKRPTLRSSKMQITYMSYSRNQIIEGVNFFLRTFVGLAPTFLKRCYLLTFIWYAKLAPTRRKCFIACQRVSSRRGNPHLTYESRHKKGNMMRKWASNTMIWMPERGSVNTKCQFLTPKMIIQRHPIHPKFLYGLIYQPKKGGTPQRLHGSFPEQYFLKRKSYET